MTQPKKKQRTTKLELVDLSPAEVRRLARPRDGFVAYVEPMVELYKANPDSMRIKGFDPDATLDAVRQIEALEPLEAAAQAQLAKIHKTRAMLESSAWRDTLKMYDRGKSAGHSDETIMRAIVPFEEFMKTGPRKKKEEEDPPVIASVVVPVTK